MKISCIIPVFNEEKQILNTLYAVSQVGAEYIDEIILVDDKSTDNTRNLIKDIKNVRVIMNEKNYGKSKTVAIGISEAVGDYILLLDADLIGLSSLDIISLIKPIKDNLADISISIRKNSPTLMKKLNIDFMSGERVFPKQMVRSGLKEMEKLPNLGLEVFLNRIIIKNKYRVVSVTWNNVDNYFKYKKRGFLVGIKMEVDMCKDVFKVISLWEWVYQNLALKKLLIKNK